MKTVLFLFVVCVGVTVGQKSNDKCNEYATVSTCPEITSEFIEGRKVKVQAKEFPHIAFIGYEKAGKLQWQCTGALIDKNFVVLPAHCTQSVAGTPKSVKLGTTQRDSDTSSTIQVINISKVFSHPEYQNTAPYHNDIALLQLSEEAQITPYVRPACLHSNTAEVITKGVTCSWGKRDEGDIKKEDLRKVTYTNVDLLKCNAQYEAILKNGLIDTQFCATTNVYGDENKCSIDISSPIHIVHPEVKCMYFLYGLTSFGKTCPENGDSDVFTKISAFVPWIESIVWK